MIRQMSLTAGLLLLLSAAPGAACDPEEMISELRAHCRDAVASAVTLIEPMQSALTAPERNAVGIKIKEATALCNADKYHEGFTLTANVARFIGHLEAHRGITPKL